MSDFKVQGQLGLDGSGFFSTLGRAEGMVGKFGGMLAGAFSIGAITAFTKSVLDLAGKLNDVSEALGINVEFLQKFINSAAKSGGSLGDLEKFLFESNKARQAAVNKPGGPEATAFKQLGFTPGDIASLNPQQFIEKLIEAFKDGATPQDINALSEIGGKSAKHLVGGFKDGLDEQTPIIREALIAELDAIGDKFTSLGTALKSTFAPVLGVVADAIRGSVNKMRQASVYLGEFLGSLWGGESMGKARRDADKATEAEIKRQRREALAESRLSQAKRDAKKETDSASPNFQPNEDAAKVKEQKGPGVYSDSRLAVGGFLGSGQSSKLGNIAERQLQTQKQSLDVAKLILGELQAGKIPLTLIIP